MSQAGLASAAPPQIAFHVRALERITVTKAPPSMAASNKLLPHSKPFRHHSPGGTPAPILALLSLNRDRLRWAYLHADDCKIST